MAISAAAVRCPCHILVNEARLNASTGVSTIPESITGLGELFGMSADLAGVLSAVAVIFNGDPVSGTWSIGGPQPDHGLLGLDLLGNPTGLSYSHNSYEGDSSIGRRDAYINDGDAHSLDPQRFASAYAMGRDNDRYTLDMLARNFLSKAKESESTNPYYFAAPFPTLVTPAAYNVSFEQSVSVCCSGAVLIYTCSLSSTFLATTPRRSPAATLTANSSRLGSASRATTRTSPGYRPTTPPRP